MSLKQEIETWVDALAQYDNNEYEEALKSFDGISDTSKILFNCGVIHATIGEHDKAVECYQRAVRLDMYLAVAYFQQGVSNFLVGDFEEALANFNDTLLYLRGNTYIDYDQLGLKFKLFSCEVLFNRGLCYIYLQQKQAGMGDLSYAQKEKVTPDHDVIDDAIREEAEGYTVFSIPVGVLYRPNSAKVKNLKTKDYLGKARLVASSDRANAFTGFSGTERQMQITQSAIAKDDRPTENISYAASNLVRNDIVSRSTRQQSAPPVNRNVFPPTPPPEGSDAPRPGITKSNTVADVTRPSLTTRANSVKNGPGGGSVRIPPRRTQLQDEGPSPGSAYPPPLETRPRLGTQRTASEPRGPPSRYASRNERANGPPASRGRLFMEAYPREERGAEADIDEYPDELYDLYRNTAYSNPYNNGGGSRRSGGGGGSRRGPSWEDRESGGSSLDDFEMMNEALPPRRSDTNRMDRDREVSRSRGTSRSRGPGGSRRPEVDVRTIRVKMHHEDDTRYVMVSTNLDYEGFLDKIREKLNMRGRLKVKVRDEGDLITVGDRDDWEMQIMTARRDARKAGEEMGRLEVWVFEV